MTEIPHDDFDPTLVESEDERLRREESARERSRAIIDRSVSLLFEDFQTYVAQTSPHPIALPVSKTDSVYIWDAYGNTFLDFTSGIGVNNLGNRNFVIESKIKEQLDHYMHTMVYGEHLQLNQVEYAKEISTRFPVRGDTPQQVFFVNSGNESVDLALKMTRKISGRKPMLAIMNGFHGRGYGAMSVSWKEEYKQGFFVDDEQNGWVSPGADFQYSEIDWDSYGGVILELVQGEAGCLPLEKEWVQELVRRVRGSGGLVVVDEVQTGYGRTGSFLAQEQFDIEADITCLGKAGGGGLPFGAVVSSRKNFEKLQTPPLSHLTTFGGNPVVCAAGLAVIRQLHEGIYSHVKEMGKLLHTEVQKLSRQYPTMIVGSQGMGLMQGLILNTEEQGPDFVDKFYKECFTRGLLLHFKLNAKSILRMSPALVISDRSIVEAVNIMAEACEGLIHSDR